MTGKGKWPYDFITCDDPTVIGLKGNNTGKELHVADLGLAIGIPRKQNISPLKSKVCDEFSQIWFDE